MRQLVYFVIGGEPRYADLLRLAVASIRRTPANDAYDIMVMCDAGYAGHITDMRGVVDIHVTAPNPTPVHASMRKTRIFDYARISEYDCALYLDCDIIISGDLSRLFDKVCDPTKLYVVPDRMDMAEHTSRYFQRGDRPYDAATLQRFAAASIWPFNAGQFAMALSTDMRGHFTAIANDIEELYDPVVHFYEQCFMNDRFNRRGAVSYAIADDCALVSALATTYGGEDGRPDLVSHFYNAAIGPAHKLALMRGCFARGGEACRAPRVMESRDQLGLLPLPARPVVAEIGVFAGAFAHSICRELRPTLLWLIDPWEGVVCSGDQDGNNVVRATGEQLKLATETRLQQYGASTRVLRKMSHDVTEIAPDSVDMVYIDGDHSYTGVQRDLLLALNWVKPGGLICGHDYCMNPAKAQHHYEFGVKQAVDEFCAQHGLRIMALMMDGCVSFAIRAMHHRHHAHAASAAQ